MTQQGLWRDEVCPAKIDWINCISLWLIFLWNRQDHVPLTFNFLKVCVYSYMHTSVKLLLPFLNKPEYFCSLLGVKMWRACYWKAPPKCYCHWRQNPMILVWQRWSTYVGIAKHWVQSWSNQHQILGVRHRYLQTGGVQRSLLLELVTKASRLGGNTVTEVTVMVYTSSQNNPQALHLQKKIKLCFAQKKRCLHKQHNLL